MPDVTAGGVAQRMKRPLAQGRARSVVALTVEDWQDRCGYTDEAAGGVARLMERMPLR